jgi:hypothetical protein
MQHIYTDDFRFPALNTLINPAIVIPLNQRIRLWGGKFNQLRLV